MNDAWIAERMSRIEASGIRRVFELAKSLKEPVDLSIGQPDFDVPAPVKEAAIDAIRAGHNGYTVTQGIAELRDKLQARVDRQCPHRDRKVLVTSGTSGGLVLALLVTVNPGDEVVIFDPYFVMYPHLVRLAGGTPVFVDTHPDFQIDLARVRAALTQRTKVMLVNSPANPTGTVLARDCLRGLAELCREHGILLVSDEVYRAFCFDQPANEPVAQAVAQPVAQPVAQFTSPSEFNEEVLVVDGFSKAYGMTGWRLGFAHGPQRLIEEMAKLQQFTFVCAPSIVQHAGLAALDVDVSGIVAEYRRKRDRIYQGLKDRFEVQPPGGAFYIYPKAPWGSGSDFATECTRNNLLVIPGVTFSQRDTHFRISYAADDRTLDRGIEILNRLAKQ